MKKYKRILAGLLCAFLLAGCVTACGPTVTVTPTGSTQAQTQQDTQVQTQRDTEAVLDIPEEGGIEEDATRAEVATRAEHGTLVEADTRGEAQTTVETNAQAPSKPSKPSYTPYVERNNYNETFTALYCSDIFQKGYFFVDPNHMGASSDLDSKIYEREIKTEEYLGVTIEGVDGGAMTEYASKFENGVSSGDDEYQMLMTHVYYAISKLIAGNYLYDMNHLESLNLEAAYWNAQMMEDLSINGKKYLAYNDFCLSNCYLVAFNKSMYAPLEREGGNLYDAVRNGEWTLDKMISVASLVEDTRDANQKKYGLSLYAWVPLVSFVTASDLKFVDKDATTGELYVVSNEGDNGTLLSLHEKLYDLCNADYTYAWGPPGMNMPTEDLTLDKGRSLMTVCSNYQLLTLKGTDVKFGVLPYPKYAAGDQILYKTLSWNGLLAVSSGVKNPKMVGDVMEMLAYYSAPVTTAFDEYLLGATAEEKPDDMEMMRLIRESQVSDLGLVFDDSSVQMDAIVYAIPQNVTILNKRDLSDHIKAYAKRADRGIKNLFK